MFKPLPSGPRDVTDSASGALIERGLEAIDELVGLLQERERELTALRRRVVDLEALSHTDECTGLFNERGLAEELEREEARARRRGESAVYLALALHEPDAVRLPLCEVGFAHALREAARGVDTLARTAAGRFAVVLAGGSYPGASAYLSRIQLFHRLLPATHSVEPPSLLAGIATRDEAGSLREARVLAEHRLQTALAGEGLA